MLQKQACSISLVQQRSRTECRLGDTFGCAACEGAQACGVAMYVQGGCRGRFLCSGSEINCGQAGDVIGLGRRRCECWFDLPKSFGVVINNSNGGVPKQGIFNVAFSWNAPTQTWWGLGRYMQGIGHLAQCWRKRTSPENHSHYLALSEHATRAHTHENYRRLAVPPNAVCDNVGEPKWVLDGAAASMVGVPAGAASRLVYCYTNGRCDTAHGWPTELPAGHRRDAFLASSFGNYLFPLPARRARELDGQAQDHELDVATHATFLTYTAPPDPADASAKNFLFFTAEGGLHALALVEPHVVYHVHALGGHAHVAHMGKAHVTHTPFGFGSHLRLSLSGGPVRVDEHTFLVAAHIANVAGGGWWNALRLTFFYAFEARPPFRVRCATAPMGFGLSRTSPPLEYATHLELHDAHLHVSVGSDNCYSYLVKLPVAEVMQKCRALPLHR